MYTAGSSVWMACRKLSTEGAARTVVGRLFHTVMVDGRNENLYTSTRVLICLMLLAWVPRVTLVLVTTFRYTMIMQTVWLIV